MGRPSEESRFPVRIVAGIIAACLVCLWGTLEYASLESAYQHQNHDPYLIADQLTRFAPLAAAVPHNAVMGYLSDAEPGSVADKVLFTSAAYALAPRLLERGATHDFVLGNFTRPSDFAAFGRSNGLGLQRDFGNGVVLFRKEHEP